MSRLSFLHVATFYPNHHFGGDAVYVQRLAEGLAERDHHVEVVHSLDAFQLLGGRCRAPRAESRVAAVHGLTGPRRGWASLMAHQLGHPWMHQGSLRRILASRTFDVIHYHNVSLFGPGVLRLGGGRATAKLYTAHDHWLVCPTHVLWKYAQRHCDKPRCLSCVLHSRRPPQWWRYTSWLARCARHVDLFLAPSQTTADTHRQRGFAEPFRVLPLFAPPASARPGSPPHPGPYFLFVGRLEALKGVHTLIPLFADLEADLLIVGEGTAGEALKAMAAGNPRIHFLDWLEPAQLDRYYAHALACLLPSQTHETFSMVSVEAFARKTPVLASALAASSGVVTSSGGGAVYNCPQELKKIMGQLLSRPGLAREWGERGYQAYCQRWTPEVHLQNYLGLVREVIARRAST